MNRHLFWSKKNITKFCGSLGFKIFPILIVSTIKCFCFLLKLISEECTICWTNGKSKSLVEFENGFCEGNKQSVRLKK